MENDNRAQVVITGIGLVTPVGQTTQENWTAIKKGQSGLSFFDHPLADQIPYKFAAQVTLDQERLNALLPAKDQRKTERFTQFALLAADEAMTDAGLNAQFPENRLRFGTYLGVGVGGVNSFLQAARIFDQGGYKKISPFLMPKAICNEAASWLSMKWNLQGPMIVTVSACSSGADAVGFAYRAIRDGYADYMLVGGTESCLVPEALAAFGNMRALSSWQGDPQYASRPFDKNRTGFVMGEGAGVMVLERKDLAEKRGANMYAQVVGFGATADAYHITAIHPEGRGACAAMRSAVEQAGVELTDVGYINAHGTATPMGDAIEAQAIRKVFGSHADPATDNHLLVSSTKSVTGHMLGAAGGAEISYVALGLKNQIVPPTMNCDEQDPACEIDVVPGVARRHSFEVGLSNSFGFGGGNAVIALKRV